MNDVMKNALKKISTEDKAAFELHCHDFRPDYSALIRLALNIEVMRESLSFCLKSDLPSFDTSHPSYVDFSVKIQTYFITAQGLKEQMNKLKLPSMEKSNKYKAILLIAKAIRNKVAHEGVWIPTYTFGSVHDVGKYEYFGLSIDELKGLVSEVKSNELRRKGNSTSDKRLDLDRTEQLAITLLENVYKSEIFDVLSFMKNHYLEVANVSLRAFELRIQREESKFIEVSTLRKQAKLPTLEERLISLNKSLTSFD